MAPKVTIVVPVYNGEQFLPACIESICAQTWTDFECVMVNDGSSDGSGAICDEVSRRDSRFRVIHQENGGLSRARNAGMRISRGEYYLFLDADDTIHPQLLELALKEQAAHPQSLITWKFTHDLSEWNSTCFPLDPSVQIYGRWDLLRFFADRVLFNSANNKLYPRKLIEKHALWFDPAAGSVEDYVFFTAFWKVFFEDFPDADIRQIDLPLYFYNQNNAGSITHTTGAAHTRHFSGYCHQQLELYAQTREIFGPFEQYPSQDVLSVTNATLNSIAFGLCNLPHPHREAAALWQIPEMKEISRWHRRYRVHNAYLFFLRLRWAGGVKWWFHVRETRPALFATVYHLGYRNILKP